MKNHKRVERHTKESEQGKIFAQGIKHFSTHLQHILHRNDCSLSFRSTDERCERWKWNGELLQTLNSSRFHFGCLTEFIFFFSSPSLDCVWFSGRDNSLNCVEFHGSSVLHVHTYRYHSAHIEFFSTRKFFLLKKIWYACLTRTSERGSWWNLKKYQIKKVLYNGERMEERMQKLDKRANTQLFRVSEWVPRINLFSVWICLVYSAEKRYPWQIVIVYFRLRDEFRSRCDYEWY